MVSLSLLALPETIEVTMFEWDEAKNHSNIEKHGLDFVAAIAVFDDPKRIESTVRRWNMVRSAPK